MAQPKPVPLQQPRRRFLQEPLPAEGENGVFSQSWFPICLSSEVGRGEVKGFDFLDGRVVVFRPSDGVARVLSAYCPHMGADLSVGDVVDDTLRCAFHHWHYDCEGNFVKLSVGDPPPAGACLFRFPTVERFGIVWAFNGEEPHWHLPDFPYPDDELVFKTARFPEPLPLDPWVLCCNTPDIQHIKALHGITFGQADPDKEIEWTDHSMLYDFRGLHRNGETIENRVGIFGTSLYYQHTVFEGRWFGFLAPFGLPRPGNVLTYMVVCARKDSGDAAEVDRFLDFVMDLETSVVSEDVRIMTTIHFRPGIMTRSDKALGRFFQYLRKYPRAHPSGPFIT
jgi:phenylpropionate dioxygenase-like ring-hydroxylating dioxygenase large terminal subunit